MDSQDSIEYLKSVIQGLNNDLATALAWQTVGHDANQALIEKKAARTDEMTKKLQADHIVLIGKQHLLNQTQAALLTEHMELRKCHAELLVLRDNIVAEKAEADSANDLKSAFLANMSHEMRTPLGVILGFSEFLLEPQQGFPDRKFCVKTIMRNGKQLLDLVNGVLDLAKIEAGKFDSDPVRFDLKHFMKGINESMGGRAKKSGLDLVFSCEDLAQVFVTVDPVRLRQLLFNVVGNAIKFTHAGTVTVTVKLVMGSPVFLEVWVRDTGIGMSAEQVKKIWSPFTQADTTTTRNYGGTGLGLSIAHQMAQALGGDLTLQHTELGVGSTFLLKLPVGEIDRAEAPSPVAADIVRAPNPLLGYRVLIVDDAADNRLLITRLLESAGAVVEIAKDGVEGTERAMASRFDIVLMDMQMPRMGGIEAATLLRQKDYQGTILALTANAMKGDREKSLAGGFTDHLTKPIDRKKLIDMMLSYPLH